MSESKLLSREAILALDDLAREEVAVPEWGGAVFVRVMTGTERGEFEIEAMRSKEKNDPALLKGIREKWVARCACDADGKRLFQDSDIAALGGKSAAALDRVFDAALKLSRLDGAEEVDALAGK